VDAALKENQDGWSLLGGMASAFQATIPINVVSLKGSADNAIGGGISHSSGDRNITADSQQNLHDRVQQSTSYIRSLQSAVIVHASQTEQNFLQTRRIANHNHCHALTVQYYEVLRQYRLRTEFVRRRKVVLIPFSPFAFDWQLALRFQTILEQVLADSSLKDCFAALVRLHMVAGIYDPSAGGSTAGGGNGSGSPPTTTSTPIKLLGTDSGKDTGIQLHKGDTLHLYRDANDKQNIHFSSALATDYADPHGEDKPADFNFTAPDLRRHSLVFKIGDAGPWQQGDIDTPSYTADRDGPLILAFNDDNYSDNGDYWALHVDVTSTFTGGTTSGGPSTVPPPAYTQVGDEVCEARLLQHLNGNRGFYLRAVWMLIDSAQRRMLLDHRIPDSILDYTDDVPLAVSGNTVAFPFNGPLSGWTEIRDDDPKLPHEDIVALPTRGLFAEAQLGHCNSCEQRDVTRMWDWTQMTTETPPEIQSIQPGPKGQPEPVPQPATMPTPVVQITQPPAAPDPVGLAAAMKVLGTPNIFRDMSGMAQVSSLLNGLASGSISLDQAQSMAKSAKAQLASDSGAGGGGGTSGATRPQNAGDLYDKMQVIDAAKKTVWVVRLGYPTSRNAVLQ